MCSPDVGAVGLEGIGLGAQLHELHPSLLPSVSPDGRARLGSCARAFLLPFPLNKAVLPCTDRRTAARESLDRELCLQVPRGYRCCCCCSNEPRRGKVGEWD